MQITSGTPTGFGYVGPNQAQVASDNQAAIGAGLIGGFKIADVLTPNDKALTGYDPDSGKINEAAIALANYRYSGAITGEVTPQFVDAIKDSIARNGGYPANPAALTPVTGGTEALAPETLGALLSIVTPPQQPA